MLVPAMNCREILAEIKKDHDKLQKTTVQRLMDEYDKERRKFKIDKSKIYSRDYAVKTHSKNTWIIVLQKSPSQPKYRDVYDVVGMCAVYYYSKEGLKVFRYTDDDTFLEVFYGHFFTRYNERMGLNLKHQTDIIKRFFRECGYFENSIKKAGNKEYTISICKDGISLGEFRRDINWLVHKTFVSHDLVREDQQAQAQWMITKRQLELLEKSLDEENPTDMKDLQQTADAIMNLQPNAAIPFDFKAWRQWLAVKDVA